MSTICVEAELVRRGLGVDLCPDPEQRKHSITDRERVVGKRVAAADFACGRGTESQPITRGRFYSIVKRILDIGISFLALVLFLPLLATVAIAIRLYDGGPIFFCQDRVGKNGRVFRFWKFRSMVVNAQSLHADLAANNNEHEDPRTFKMANDPRVTPVGRFLRRFSLDEFPQLINVLLGDMSIVGPRPPLPTEVELYSPSDFQRLAVTPGLTCIWQVSGRCRLPFPEQVRMDIEYIRRRSLLLDLAIVMKTVPAVLSGDGAA